MAVINHDYTRLKSSYLFSMIAGRVRTYEESHPKADIIRLGIGDVTRPLTPTIIDAMHKAVDEMADAGSFRGYAPDLGYGFLRSAIAQNDYRDRGMDISDDEIFVSDGAKSDSGNIQEIFGRDNTVAVCDPVYPVYVDTNVMAGRAGEYDESSGRWSDIFYMPCLKENDFVPLLPDEMGQGKALTVPDIIYLCFPNNPTGAVLSKAKLQGFVDYANAHGSVIIFDAAYEGYIREEGIPHSIYECEGAKSCAIELRSFSKNAGFTGVRLGFTVIPKSLIREGVSLHSLWARRHGTKYNGAPYIIQRAGEAVYSEEGKREIRGLIDYYMDNAAYILNGLKKAGYNVSGGVNAPYIWLETPKGLSSWDFFDLLLDKAGVVGTPGVGFGPHGEGYLRLTAFGDKERTIQAVDRIASMSV